MTTAAELHRRRMGRRRRRCAEHQSVQHRRRGRRVRARQRRRRRARDRRGARRVPGLVAQRHPAAPRHPRRRSATRSSRARTSSAGCSSREEGKTLPEGIGEAARAGQIFQFFAGEVRAPRRREARLGAARRRRRDHARAGRRGRHHHAVEFPDRDPGLEDRAGARLRQLRRVQAGRPRARHRAWALAEIIARAGVPAGVFNLVMGRGSVVGEALLDAPGVDAISFTGSVATGQKVAAACVARHDEVPARDGRQEPAGRARRRRPRRSRSNARSTARSSRPASAARRRRG